MHKALDTPTALRLPSFARKRTMRSLSRLSLASTAILLCSAGLHAQTSAPTQPAPWPNPAPLAAPISPLLSTGQSSSPQQSGLSFRLPPLSPGTIYNLKALKAQRPALLARNDGPCYALRAYGFTTGHDPAAAPRLSSHTTCTPASGTHLRELVKNPSAH
jgi:hypothetical protein